MKVLTFLCHGKMDDGVVMSDEGVPGPPTYLVPANVTVTMATEPGQTIGPQAAIKYAKDASGLPHTYPPAAPLPNMRLVPLRGTLRTEARTKTKGCGTLFLDTECSLAELVTKLARAKDDIELRLICCSSTGRRTDKKIRSVEDVQLAREEKRIMEQYALDPDAALELVKNSKDPDGLMGFKNISIAVTAQQVAAIKGSGVEHLWSVADAIWHAEERAVLCILGGAEDNDVRSDIRTAAVTARNALMEAVRQVPWHMPEAHVAFRLCYEKRKQRHKPSAALWSFLDENVPDLVKPYKDLLQVIEAAVEYKRVPVKENWASFHRRCAFYQGIDGLREISAVREALRAQRGQSRPEEEERGPTKWQRTADSADDGARTALNTAVNAFKKRAGVRIRHNSEVLEGVVVSDEEWERLRTTATLVTSGQELVFTMEDLRGSMGGEMWTFPCLLVIRPEAVPVTAGLYVQPGRDRYPATPGHPAVARPSATREAAAEVPFPARRLQVQMRNRPPATRENPAPACPPATPEGELAAAVTFLASRLQVQMWDGTDYLGDVEVPAEGWERMRTEAVAWPTQDRTLAFGMEDLRGVMGGQMWTFPCLLVISPAYTVDEKTHVPKSYRLLLQPGRQAVPATPGEKF
ncbi:hypothetical protein [Streptomyces sp. NPDC086023]|uniref:hypothetical protein n=1 Tax=Streptomyces sp. NPDC086023 TaxID=3365746 RepID=UPI0037CDD81D